MNGDEHCVKTRYQKENLSLRVCVITCVVVCMGVRVFLNVCGICVRKREREIELV